MGGWSVLVGAEKTAQKTFSVQSFSGTLRVKDVRAENRGFSCGFGGGEKLFDLWASGRKGQGRNETNKQENTYPEPGK